MRIRKWEPLSDFFNILERNRRFFDEYSDEEEKNNLSMSAWTPLTDIHETKEAFLFKIELPGFTKDQIQVEINDNTLLIKGERKQEEEVKKENCFRLERSYGMFQRTFSLPRNVDAKKIEASLKDGVLRLSLPKAEESKTKAIPIKVQ